MKLKDSTCMVIGGAGFIGSFIVKELLKEDIAQVIIYDNFARGKKENITFCLENKRCRLCQGDIREQDVLQEAMKGVDYVFCTAALWLLHCIEFPRTAFDVNITGTFNVLEACVKNNIKKLIWSSSASVYGDAMELPMTEMHPFNNKNFYGATKIAGEAMITSFNNQYGLPVIGLRYMNVYGPGQDQNAAYTGVIPILLNKIDAGETLVINGDGTQAYDFIYVEDAARCNIDALKSEVSFGFYNVATGKQTNIKDLCDLIMHLKNSDLPVEYKPYGKGDAKAMVQNRIGSTVKTQRELGFLFRNGLEEGLRKLIEWRAPKINYLL